MPTRTLRSIVAAGVLASAALASVTLGASHATAATSSLGFNAPEDVVISGPNAFVANSVGNSVTEFNTATGQLVRVLSAKSYGFNAPEAVVISGPNAFVTNSNGVLKGGSVTEFNTATGQLVRVLSAKSYGAPV